MAVFVDSNVIIDVLGKPSRWRSWSNEQLVEWADRGPMLINDIVYAEVSVGFSRQDDFEGTLGQLGLDRLAPSAPALFAAGKAFLAYRMSRGPSATILPDFLIGAHAAALGVPLITRDPRRFKSYFPALVLVTPESN